MKNLIAKIRGIITDNIIDRIITAIITIVTSMVLNLFYNVVGFFMGLKNTFFIIVTCIILVTGFYFLVFTLVKFIRNKWAKSDSSHSLPYLQEFNQLLKDFYKFIDTRTTYSFLNLSANSFDELHPINSHYWELKKRFDEKRITKSILLDEFIDEFNSLFNDFQQVVKKFKVKIPGFKSTVLNFDIDYLSLKDTYNAYKNEYIKLNKNLNKNFNIPEILP
jgi:ABC-type multidrug transport system fused ATPase/permease subunit